MASQRGSEKRQLTEAILIRMEPDEKARLAELAEAEDMTLAAFVRLRLAGGSAAPRAGQTLLASNMALVRELRSLGGLVRQLLTTREHAKEGRDVLAAITAAIADVSRRR